MHISVPLMHSRGRCGGGVLFCVCVCCTSREHSGCCQVSCCYCGTLGPPSRRSSCNKRALKRHTKATPAVRRGASQSKSSCGVHVRRTFCCPPSPLRSRSLALGGMCGRREGWMDGWMEERREGGREGGRGSLLFVSLSLSPHLRLFGEFADDTDQCSIFIFKTLVVCSQVNQNLPLQLQQG